MFWELAGDRALAEAEAALSGLRTGDRLPVMSGVPVPVKDAFAVNGLRQHLGLTRDVVSERDALAVRKLSEAGAVVIGTTAMDQLAWTMIDRTGTGLHTM